MSSNRKTEYDFVRAVAMLFVVGVHSLVLLDSSWRGYFLTANIAKTIFLPANAIFFFISGFFALRLSAADAPLAYYGRKVRAILIPVVLAFFLRTVVDGWGMDRSALTLLKTFGKNFLFAYSGNEYWFLYSLVPLYVFVPFLSRAFVGSTRQQHNIFVVVTLCYATLRFGLASMGYSFAWNNIFAGFASLFVVGSFLEQMVDTDKKRHVLYGLAFAGFVSTVALVMYGFTDHQAGAWSHSPLYIILSAGMYIGLLQVARRFNIQGKAIAFVARHSFMVYLVHSSVIAKISRFVPFYGGAASIASWAILMVATFAISLAAAVLIDTCLVTPLQLAYDRLMACFDANKKEARA